MYNVFDTEQEALDAEGYDFLDYKAAHYVESDAKYWNTTIKWANVKQRLDSKWVYPVCPEGSQDHTQEEYQSDWFPIDS
jgi:hypothetical protein